MSSLKKLKTLVGVELPTNRRECIGITFPNIPGCNTSANKAWQIAKSIKSVMAFHTEDCPLTQKQVDGLLSLDAIKDEDYNTFYFKIEYIYAWVEDGVICNA